MKYYSFCPFILATFFAFTANSQNLVPNPSFEEYIDCPFSSVGLNDEVIEWFSWGWTPDYFNVCNNDISGIVGVPSNFLGYQFPILGEAYAGIVTYQDIEPNLREYIAAELSEPLIIGQTYYISFYVSFRNGGIESSSLCATNHLGLRFFKDPNYSETNELMPDNFAHLDYSEILTDTLNWIKIEGTIIADQDYNWLAIGNFFSDENTNIEILNSSEETCLGYYYIENVCVTNDSSSCDYLLGINRNPYKKLSIYPNPTISYLSFEYLNEDILTIDVYDINGKFISNKSNIHSEYITIDTSQFTKGIYLVKITTTYSVYNQKILKQ